MNISYTENTGTNYTSIKQLPSGQSQWKDTVPEYYHTPAKGQLIEYQLWSQILLKSLSISKIQTKELQYEAAHTPAPKSKAMEREHTEPRSNETREEGVRNTVAVYSSDYTQSGKVCLQACT